MQPSLFAIVITIVFGQTAKEADLERRLVDGCKKGDRLAQQRLYNRYSKAMFNICLRMLKQEADAEDALQMAFVEVFTKLDSFRFESTIGAWIKRIVVNTCINHLKKRRLNTVDWDDVVPDQVEFVEDTGDTAYQVEKVRNAIMDLPDGYRVVLSLYLLEGYDHGEIGQILNISEATSKSQYSRAKQKIRQMLLDES